MEKFARIIQFSIYVTDVIYR